MRQLFYTNYQSGNSGLSNGIMSIECGVIMAFLTKRLLVLDGNTAPPANIVDYAGRVDNSSPSRVSDLIDIPVPWVGSEEAELQGLSSAELTSHNLMDSVFYVPGTVDVLSEDAAAFARGRNNWICEDERLREIDVLRVSEDPIAPGQDRHRHNLSFYSYLFYLDSEYRRAVYELLTRMQAKQPYAQLAKRIATDLGPFNAVHMRRGDFKVTYGVTVLDRQPWEAIDALDQHFSRDDRLLICTDERDDPFFDEIKRAWPDHIFIDHYILDHYLDDFLSLPTHDSLALAFLSQLIAAQSKDFIGSMTSTFTAMIQRLRGSAGEQELFKFLWNELPDPGTHVERGRHPISECVPLEKGVMIQEFEGPYTWNRYSQLLNPAWMREWPESFLTEQAISSGQIGLEGTEFPAGSGRETRSLVAQFEGVGIRVQSSSAKLIDTLVDSFSVAGDAGNVIADIEIQQLGTSFRLRAKDRIISEVTEASEIPGALLQYTVPILSRVRKNCSWFDGAVIDCEGSTIMIVGDAGLGQILTILREQTRRLTVEGAVALRDDSLEPVPFYVGARSANKASGQQALAPITAVVRTRRLLQHRPRVLALSPSAAVAEMSQSSWDFRLNREKAMPRLCELATRVPVYQLDYCHAGEVPDMLMELSEHISVLPQA